MEEAPNRAKKILFINLYSDMGGGEHALYNLLKRLDRKRFHAIMMFNEHGVFAEQVKSLGIETVVIPYQVVMLRELAYPTRFYRMVKSSRLITDYLKNNRVEIIHCSDVLSLILIAYPVVRYRPRVIYNVIFFYEWIRILLFNLLAIMLVDRIVANSSVVAENLRRRTFLLSSKIDVVRQGVDLTVFRPSRKGEGSILRRQLGLKDDVCLVGMAGRFDPQKGHTIFLEAAAVVLRTRPDTKFVVIGGLLFAEVFPFYREYYADVMACHRRLGLEESVFFLDHRDDMPEVMRSLDVFVLPSTQEGFGLVVLEALASGVPVVLSKSAGAAEVVQDIPTVFFAEHGNSESFAGAILSAFDASDSRGESVGISARDALVQRSLKKLEWEGPARRMEEIYQAA